MNFKTTYQFNTTALKLFKLFTIHYSLFMSMDGRYAENRLERFQCIIHCF